jgi:hypothetical protein
LNAWEERQSSSFSLEESKIEMRANTTDNFRVVTTAVFDVVKQKKLEILSNSKFLHDASRLEGAEFEPDSDRFNMYCYNEYKI